jgi:hypothetical protein
LCDICAPSEHISPAALHAALHEAASGPTIQPSSTLPEGCVIACTAGTACMYMWCTSNAGAQQAHTRGAVHRIVLLARHTRRAELMCSAHRGIDEARAHESDESGRASHQLGDIC